MVTQIIILFIFTITIVKAQLIDFSTPWKGVIKFETPILRDASYFNETYYAFYNDYSTKEWTFPASVPGGIYTDLLNANLIPENLIGKNDVRNRWVGNQLITYTTHFNVSKGKLQSPRILLIFHGLDTFATIFVNNIEIARVSNMFLRYTFDIKNYVLEGENKLMIEFDSAVKVAQRLYDEQSKNYVVLPICVPKDYNGECHVNHIRKMQASFAWDWGPAFPSIGIWKKVEIIALNEVKITDVTTNVYKQENGWNIDIMIFMSSPFYNSNNVVEAKVSSKLFTDSNNHLEATLDLNLPHYKIFNISLQLDVPENQVRKWWPNGYGDQNLYTLQTCVSSKNGLNCKNIRIGFRTVELVQESLREGLSFYFRINGVPIFAKGSNFIPASVFPELSANEETIRHLLFSAKETHMNMLRVWGGGYYESDLFYDIADEYGIMIWQDFLFACSMYPTTEVFLESVKEEITQNTIRLKNHPSLVIWAGNNENEAALYGNWYGTGSEKIYKDDYKKLYVDLIKNEINRLDPVRPFVVSSPTNGLYSEENNYVGTNPYSNLYGDVHYYNYIKNGWDIDQYPRARFSSEYGFQAMPSIHTLTKAAETIEDLKIGSDFLKHRQHLPFGFPLMNLLLSKNFIVPKNVTDLGDLVNYIYLSQINQAVSVRIQTESYRQAVSDLNEIGEGMTMGALYWQLNDVWQAPSWSSIEFGGRWKMLHYYAREFFSPVIITPHLSEIGELKIFVVSDKQQTFFNNTAVLDVYKWETMTPVHSVILPNVTLQFNRAYLLTSIWLSDLLKESKCGDVESMKTRCVVTLTLKDENGFQIAPRNYVYPSPLKNVNMPIANVTMKIEDRILPGKYSNYTDFVITLKTDKIALFVWLEVVSICGRFSENGFHMFEMEKSVIFHACESTTEKLLQSELRIMTFSDINNPDKFFNNSYFTQNI